MRGNVSSCSSSGQRKLRCRFQCRRKAQFRSHVSSEKGYIQTREEEGSPNTLVGDEERKMSEMDENMGTPVATVDRPGPENDTSKLLAALGYIIGIVALVAILIDPYKNEKFVKFHAVQALAIWVGWFAVSVVSVIPILGWIISAVGWIALLVFAIMGAVKAFQSEYWEMPVVYGLVKNYM